MSRRGVIFLRIVQVLLAVGNLVVAAYVYNWYASTAHQNSPGSLQFLIFAPCASLASVVYLEMARRQSQMVLAHLLASLGVEGFNSILYFGGFIAFALSLSESEECEGIICTLSRALAVLAAAEFSAWIASTILAAQNWFKSEEVQANKDMTEHRPMGQA